MIKLRVLSTAAAIALVLPMLASTASFAGNWNGKAVQGGGAARFSGGGAPNARFGGGGMGTRFSGGGGGGAPVAQFRSGGGGNWHGGYGGYRSGGGFIPGAVAGAVIGGALASQSYGYYGGPGYYGDSGYYAPGYYDDQYYDEGAVAVAPGPAGGDDSAYCAQTYRSYDPRSGTYLGYDNMRHPCP